MKLKTFFRSSVTVILLAAAGQAGAVSSDFVSGIPNHLNEASFSEQVQGRASVNTGMRHFPIQWTAASTIITASQQATFGGSAAHEIPGGWLYLPPVMEGWHWAMFGAVLMLLGMVARHKTMPRT